MNCIMYIKLAGQSVSGLETGQVPSKTEMPV